MHFTKMHGLGNDYLYVLGDPPRDVERLAVRLSDRHFGAGSDGMIYIGPSTVADFKMRIFNADGTEAMMCGNGIRCVGKYVFDKGLTDKTTLAIETRSGIRTLALDVEDGKVTSAAVDMGRAEVGPALTLEVKGQAVCGHPVSVGNPHLVVFVDDVAATDVAGLGHAIEFHEDLPERVNVEFVQRLSETELRMRVWERGSGITMACGTGSCATVAAAVKAGLCPAGLPVTVLLDGGPIEVVVTRTFAVTMRGPAVTVYEGEVEL